ncbi:hypothetical protein LCL96_14505 [Rossellomorea aquimaris]|uniref:hypothetical protein n=1 Tax=Rossellomorea aquimaris TaxID=189382 RepID=UPI001CD1E2C8|nr:hypothetical protein [Rossellomorea aquimaris]MCA1060146.1 hypothetical protein [Rossellomorea aquimaris]
MIVTVDKRDDLVIQDSKLERLYLTQQFYALRNSILENKNISEENLSTISDFLSSGKAHYEGIFLDFHQLETSEIYSLISKSLTPEQILQSSFKDNVEHLLNSLSNVSSLSEADRKILVNFLSSLISNLTTKKISNQRNYFDW